jgi:hypothetical protein
MIIKSTSVLIIAAIPRLTFSFSRKLENGNISKVSKIPKEKGTRKGAPKYKMPKISIMKSNSLLIFVSLFMIVCVFTLVEFSLPVDFTFDYIL